MVFTRSFTKDEKNFKNTVNYSLLADFQNASEGSFAFPTLMALVGLPALLKGRCAAVLPLRGVGACCLFVLR